MVVGVVADVAGDVLLLEPADAMLEAGRAGDRPRARECLLVAPVGLEVLAVRLGEVRLDRRDRVDLPGQPPPGAAREASRREEGHPGGGLVPGPRRPARRRQTTR